MRDGTPGGVDEDVETILGKVGRQHVARILPMSRTHRIRTESDAVNKERRVIPRFASSLLVRSGAKRLLPRFSGKSPNEIA